MDKLVQDLQYSLRMLRKSPLATAAAVFSLAIGIGANTAMFSWLDDLVLSPLRVQEPGQLVPPPDGHQPLTIARLVVLPTRFQLATQQRDLSGKLRH